MDSQEAPSPYRPSALSSLDNILARPIPGDGPKVIPESFTPNSTPHPTSSSDENLAVLSPPMHKDRSTKRPLTGGKAPIQARGRKHLSVDQLKMLSRRIDPLNPLPPPSKRLRYHHFTSPLYKTCRSIWPSGQPSSSLGIFSHNSIRAMSDLLKVRLCQAKFRALAALETEPECRELCSYLRTDTSYREPENLSHKRTTSYSPVVGNGRNLFVLRHTKSAKCRRRQQPQPSQSVTSDTDHTNVMIVSENSRKRSASGAPQQNKRKRSRKRQQLAKPKRELQALFAVTLEDGKDTLVDIMPTNLRIGSRAFVCEPCNKKYKNPGGLRYHLDRCKYRSNDENNLKSNISTTACCICLQTTQAKDTLMQCTKCKFWLHHRCTGLREEALGDAYQCPKCSDDVHVSSANAEAEADNEDSLILHESKDTQDSQCQKAELLSICNGSYHDGDDEGDVPLKEEHIESLSPVENISLDALSDREYVSQPHGWDGFSLSSDHAAPDENLASDGAWSKLSDDGSGLPSTSWSFSEANIAHPPSLLFSDATLNSIIDDDIPSALSTDAMTMDQTNSSTTATSAPTSSPSYDITMGQESSWFEFANFEDDYHYNNAQVS